MKTTNERISISVGDAEMGAYVAKPEGEGSWPGVLLFMEIFGINEHIRSVVDRVAAEGYVVLAPDVFHRTAAGIELGYDEEGLARGIELMSATKAEELLADIGAAIEALKARSDVGGSGIGAMGFCFGGHLAFRTACEFPIKATVSFYGGGIPAAPGSGGGPATIDRTSEIEGKILCLFGDQDDYIPAADVDQIRGALDLADTDYEIVVYPGVGHGFFCDVREGYDEKSAKDAWAKLTKLFATELA
jgi:carboxymethylenebutenolidase